MVDQDSSYNVTPGGGLSPDFQVGMKATVSRTIRIDGLYAFYKGETVVIDAIDPNPSALSTAT